MKKRVLAVLLMVALVLPMFPTSLFAAEIIASGKCGENVTWELDSDGVLTISGSGDMMDYKSLERPWGSVKKAVIKNGVTSIGSNAFGNCNSLESITIPDSVTIIESNAFGYCDSLTSITIGNGVTSIGRFAFFACNLLTDVYYTGTEAQWNEIEIESYNDYLTNATIHFNSTGPNTVKGSGSVRLFTSWDAQNQVAYFGEFDFLGCKVTEKTDTSFLANAENLIGKYVWVESEPVGNGMVDSDTLICIKVVETRTGTVSSADATKIIIDGIAYDTPESVTLLGIFVGEIVRYYLSLDGELLELELTDGSGNNDNNNNSNSLTTSATFVDGDGNIYTNMNDGIVGIESFADIGMWGSDSQDPSSAYGINGSCYMEIDLQTNCNVESIWAAHIVVSGRFYKWDAYVTNDNTKPISEWVKVGGKTDDTESTTEGYALTLDTPVNCRYIRLYGMYNSHNLGFHFSEIKVTGTKSDSNNDNKPDDDQNNDNSNLNRDYEIRKEWVNKHVAYASSELYKSTVKQCFNGALGNALSDIKGNGSITAYNTLDSINSILDFNLDLTDVEEYELLLAQILFSRTGTTTIDEIYDEYLSSNIITICEFLLENVPEMATPEIKKQIEKLKGLSKSDTQYSKILNQIFSEFNNYDDLNFGKECIEAFDSAGLNFAANFLSSEIENATDTLSQAIVYMAAGEAYCNTVTSFGDMLIALRKRIAIPSDNPLFEPYSSNDKIVNERMLRTVLGISDDPLNTPIYLSALATAIENFYTQLEAYKTGKAKTVADNAMVTFVEGTASNLVNAELEVALSLFECLPVVKEFTAIKALFNGTQFAMDVFTSIDDRAYLVPMVMRLCGIAYIHYLTVDDLAKSANSWGEAYYPLPVGLVFDENRQYGQATLFDEAIQTHKAIWEVAMVYAKEYYATYLNSKLIAPTSKIQISYKILELNKQKELLSKNICCHGEFLDNGISNNPYYNTKAFKIYTFTCPVEITVKNENNEIIAVVSNSVIDIMEGYEQFFYITETENDSDDYIKIFLVPEEYEITLTGSDTGTMNVYVSSLIEESLGETQAFMDVPLTPQTTGYFSKTDTETDISLVVDEVEYLPVDDPDKIPNDNTSPNESESDIPVSSQDSVAFNSSESENSVSPDDKPSPVLKKNAPIVVWIIIPLLAVSLSAVLIVIFIKKKKR